MDSQPPLPDKRAKVHERLFPIVKTVLYACCAIDADVNRDMSIREFNRRWIDGLDFDRFGDELEDVFNFSYMLLPELRWPYPADLRFFWLTLRKLPFSSIDEWLGWFIREGLYKAEICVCNSNTPLSPDELDDYLAAGSYERHPHYKKYFGD